MKTMIRRFAGIMAVLVLVLGLVPGMGLTAWADGSIVIRMTASSRALQRVSL